MRYSPHQLAYFAHKLTLRAATDSMDRMAGALHLALSWTHYRTLIKVERREVRDFYEIEAIRSGWSARQLGRRPLLPRSGASRYQFVLPSVDQLRAEMQRELAQLGQNVSDESLAATGKPGLQVGKTAARTAKPEKRKSTGKIKGEKR